MALSPSLCEGVKPGERTFERATQRLAVSLPSGDTGVEAGNGVL